MSADPLEDWTHANDLFHQSILDAAATPGCAAARGPPPHDPARPDLDRARGNARLLEENVEQHDAILQAIERRDGAGRGAMVEHVRSAGALVTLRFEQRSS